ncbi:MAG TPA: hypothetical protein VLA34_15385 [Candidatus Krumholzibacterium sp.]|nr:hypothetical protein [Candidatus Krumholzibacterium sp.]
MRRLTVITALLMLAGTRLYAEGNASGGQDASALPDSTEVFAWSAVFSGDLHKYRFSAPFRWNAPESGQWSSGRLSADLRYFPRAGVEMMLRVSAADDGPGGEVYGGTMTLEQGHVTVALERAGLQARLFMRERVYRTGNRLILPVSSDAVLLQGRGEGIVLDYSPGPFLGLSFTGSSLPADEDVRLRGGFPVFQGWGGGFGLFTLRSRAGILDAGVFLSETRSPRSGDGVVSGIDIGIDLRGIRLQVETARSATGRIEDQKGSLFSSFRPDLLRIGDTSGAFGDDDAFSAEVHGLVLSSGKYGTFGVVPGYDYSGRAFEDPQGEIEKGRVESRITAWWRHPVNALYLHLHAADTYDRAGGLSGRNIRGIARSRFKSGLETTAGLILREGEDPSAVLSVLDDNSTARIMATARIDDPGGAGVLSFITEGHLNISGNIAVRSVLYLERSLESLYCVQLEYRSGRRMLFRAGLGTFVPADHSSGLMFDPAPPSIERDRYISFFTRIALGDL